MGARLCNNRRSPVMTGPACGPSGHSAKRTDASEVQPLGLGPQEFPERLVKGAESLDRLPAPFGEAGPSPLPASYRGLDQGAFRLPVDGVHQLPCMAVGHVHGAGGLGYGAESLNAFEEFNPSVSQEGAVVPLYPYPSPEGVGSLFHSGVWRRGVLVGGQKAGVGIRYLHFIVPSAIERS